MGLAGQQRMINSSLGYGYDRDAAKLLVSSGVALADSNLALFRPRFAIVGITANTWALAEHSIPRKLRRFFQAGSLPLASD